VKTIKIKILLCLLGLSLPVTLASVTVAQNKTSSILERVQSEEDPELAELIRMAIENRRNVSNETTFEIIRGVSQSYAQLRLLDLQIQEVSRKVESQTGPAEMRYELLLAKAELESKRAAEMANLREVMGIVPRLPFAKQRVKTLKAFLSLQRIGERVYVLEGQKPFKEYWIYRRWKLAGWLSEKETLEYIQGKLKDGNNLPIRIDIHYKRGTKDGAENLRNKIIPLAKETNSQMDTEVRLELIEMAGSGTSPFFLRQGKITTFYSYAMKRPDGGSEHLSSGQVNPNDLEQHILWRLLKPGNVPLTFRIEYDQASALMAKLVADTVRDVLKRLGIVELIGIESVIVEPVPEKAFLGRWRGTTRGDFQTIEVQPNGICQVTMGDRFGEKFKSGTVKTGMSVSGTWSLTTNKIVIDINDKIPDGPKFVYGGDIDEKDNLIIERGEITGQGSLLRGPRTILEKVK
jgi:hypothetical protein